MTKHVDKFLADKKIPHHRWWYKVRKAVLGFALIGVTFYFQHVDWFPEEVHALFWIVGGFLVGEDLLRKFGPFAKALAKDLAEAIATLKKAIKG
jgi:hypothetical protein